MSNEGFSWKSLFVNDVNEQSSQSEVTVQTQVASQPTVSKFPDAVSTGNSSFPTQPAVNNPFINEIVDVYQKGFDSLNLADFDFYEMYKSVMAVGVTNPQSYQMAFTMGKTLKSDLTKQFLIEKSKYYITEIEKVHAKFDSTGWAKKTDLDNRIMKDKTQLVQKVSDLEAQIVKLQQELQERKLELNSIDSGSQEQYSEIQMKLEANNYAKNKIIDSVNLVVSGINQYL